MQHNEEHFLLRWKQYRMEAHHSQILIRLRWYRLVPLKMGSERVTPEDGLASRNGAR